MPETGIEIADLSEPALTAARQCELLGIETNLIRNGRAVAAIVSWDELTALRETLAIVADPPLASRLDAIRRSVEQGAIETREGLAFAQGAGELPSDLEEILRDDPIRGVPLFPPLRGMWSLRGASVRAIYLFAPGGGQIAVLDVSPLPEDAP